MILTAQLNPFGKGKSVPPAAGEDLQQQWRQVAATLCLPVPAGNEARREDDSNSLSHSRRGGVIHPRVAACTGAAKRTASSDVRTGLRRRWQLAPLHRRSVAHREVNPF